VIIMSNLIKEYQTAAKDHGTWTRGGDSDKTNAAHEKMHEVLAALVAAREDGQLFTLYDDSDPWVQLWAATHTLEVDAARATAKLESLQRSGIPLASMCAKYTLQSWKDGDLRFRD
jgi:hypothetical protein